MNICFTTENSASASPESRSKTALAAIRQTPGHCILLKAVSGS
jgi:hypothetical protein